MSARPQVAQSQPAPRASTVTHHAALRGVERFGLRTTARSTAVIEAAFDTSVKLPWRYGRQLSLRPAPVKQVGRRVDVRVAGSMLLICRGRRVLTTWRMTDAQFSTVSWFVITGAWVPDDGSQD